MNNEIDNLARLLSKLPGLGARSSRRAVLHLIKNREQISLISRALNEVDINIKTCSKCGNIDVVSPCNICVDPKRDETQLCIVEEVSDLWAINRSNIFRGRYVVLGGTLSAIDGRGPDSINIKNIIDFVDNGEIKEVIIATNATIEGQTTAHYITEKLSDYKLKISRLGHGMPIGGELDYLDDATLLAALNSRMQFND